MDNNLFEYEMKRRSLMIEQDEKHPGRGALGSDAEGARWYRDEQCWNCDEPVIKRMNIFERMARWLERIDRRWSKKGARDATRAGAAEGAARVTQA